MKLLGGGGQTFIHRDEPDGFDFTLTNFTRNAAWHTLDLSSIIPVGTVGVNIFCRIDTASTNQHITFRKEAAATSYNNVSAQIESGNNKVVINALIACTVARTIQYKASTNLTEINFTVCDWII